MILLSISAALAENKKIKNVYYGAQAHDLYGYWDTTSAFVDRLNDVQRLNGNGNVKIIAPFVNKSKREVLSIGTKLGIDYERTWSCYSGKELACGNCPTCSERLNAFSSLGLVDPIKYEKEK